MKDSKVKVEVDVEDEKVMMNGIERKSIKSVENENRALASSD